MAQGQFLIQKKKKGFIRKHFKAHEAKKRVYELVAALGWYIHTYINITVKYILAQ